VIAPESMDALADVARALGFELRRAEHSVPVGVDYDRAKEQSQFALLRGGQVAFDGTARECSAFLVGWRDLRSEMLSALRAENTSAMPDMHSVTLCHVVDPCGLDWCIGCIAPAGHAGPHVRIQRWQDKPQGSDE
jgi:hypothetical protein